MPCTFGNQDFLQVYLCTPEPSASVPPGSAASSSSIPARRYRNVPEGNVFSIAKGGYGWKSRHGKNREPCSIYPTATVMLYVEAVCKALHWTKYLFDEANKLMIGCANQQSATKSEFSGIGPSGLRFHEHCQAANLDFLSRFVPLTIYCCVVRADNRKAEPEAKGRRQ